MTIQEVADDISGKGEGHAPVVLSPPIDLLVGVRPQQITQQPLKKKIQDVKSYKLLLELWKNTVQHDVKSCDFSN